MGTATIKARFPWDTHSMMDEGGRLDVFVVGRMCNVGAFLYPAGSAVLA